MQSVCIEIVIGLCVGGFCIIWDLGNSISSWGGGKPFSVQLVNAYL